MFESIGPWLADDLAVRMGVSTTTGRVLAPFAAVLASWLLGLALERGILFLAGRAAGTRTHLDDVLGRALRGPVRFFALLAGVGLALLLAPLPATFHAWTRLALGAVLGLALVVFAARLAAGLVDAYGATARLEGPTRRLARRVSGLAIWSLGILLVLQAQGINVTPLLTTLGLAGLAVALAFQDTLSNLFAGVYVQADKPLDVGHYVRFEEHNLEGYVVEVGWRTTKIRTLGNNLVVIPNARVASSIVTDYDLPEPRMSLLVRVAVHHGGDPARVAGIVEDEARKAAGSIEGFLAEPAPFVRFIPGFTEQGLEFTLVAQVRTFVDQYLVQDELRRRIDARLRSEGIPLGAPRRILEIQGPPA